MVDFCRPGHILLIIVLSIVLVSFWHCVYRYHKRPRMKAQKMENLSIAFTFMLDVEHIPLVNIGKHKLCHYGDGLFLWICGICDFIYRQVKEFKS